MTDNFHFVISPQEIRLVFMALGIAGVVLTLYGLFEWIVKRILGAAKRKLMRDFAGLAYEPQSARPESPYLYSKVPDCQFSVWSSGGPAETKVLLGHGYRDGDWLVCPTHVVTASPVANLVVQQTKGRVHEVLDVVSMAAFDWREVGSDVSVARLNRSLSGLKSAKIGPISGKLLVAISTAFSNANSSVGRLSLSGFGVLEYSGSTRPGFSGAVYLCQGVVVGMHLGGGVVNVAYATSYLRNLIHHPESSEFEALRRILMNARRSDFQTATTGDPDYMQIEHNGRYYVLEKDEFRRLMAEYNDDEPEDEWDESPRQRPGRRARRSARRAHDEEEFYEGPGAYGEDVYEYSPESGNAEGAHLGPSTSLKSDVDTLRQLLSVFVEKVHSSQTASSEALSGQIEELKRLRDQYQSTQQSLNEQEKALRSLTSENARLRAHFSQLTTRLDSITVPAQTPLLRVEGGSKDCLQPSTSREVQGLEYSPETSQMARRSDGTDFTVKTPPQSKSSARRRKRVLTSSLRKEISELQQQISNYSSRMSPIPQPRLNKDGSG